MHDNMRGADPEATAQHTSARERPRWLAAAVVLLVSVAIGSVIALVRGTDDNSKTSSSGSDPAATHAPASAPDTLVATSDLSPATTEPSTQATATLATADASETSPPASDSATTADTSTPSTYGTVEPGQGIATLKIPKVHLTAYVLAGTAAEQMAAAVGHLSSTSAPGQLGNAVLVGYRTTKPAPFLDLDRLAAGDVIEIDTVLGGVYFYSIDSSVVVEPGDESVLAATDPSAATLSLVTCTPKYSTNQRLVVHATLVEALSSPPAEAQVNYGQPGPVPNPSSDPCNIVQAVGI